MGARTGSASSYEAYVPGEISAWEPDLPASLAADASRVETAVRDLARHAPLLGALAWPLLRTEAIASSRIEGLGVSHHRLALADDPRRDDPLARAVRANLDALRRALDLSGGPITTEALLEIHRSLLSGTPADAVAGTIRDRQNWIGRGTAALAERRSSAAARARSSACSSTLRVLQRDDLPALVQAAIAHAQFETIHPFADGNGRTGRALIQVLLRRRGGDRRRSVAARVPARVADPRRRLRRLRGRPHGLSGRRSPGLARVLHLRGAPRRGRPNGWRRRWLRFRPTGERGPEPPGAIRPRRR